MKQKLLLKTMLLLFALIAGSSSVWAVEQVYKTLTFCNAGTETNKTGGYTSSWDETVGTAPNDFSWTIANFNNNNWIWTDGDPSLYVVKCGRKRTGSSPSYTPTPSIATITTKTVIDEAITKVVVTLTAINASDYNSIKLYMASNATFDANLVTVNVSPIPTAAGAMTITIPEANRAANRYYKIEFDTKGETSGNGHTGVKKVEYYYNYVSSATLDHITLGGTYQTSFEQGSEFNHDGMTVTAHYDDSSTADVTSIATFTDYNMNTLGDQTVTVSYTEGGVTKSTTYGINVVPAPTAVVTLNLSSNTNWGFPTSKTEGPATYTNSGYSITLEGSGNGYYFDTTNNNLLLGKKDATLTLPAFGFNVSKIKVYGASGASASVTFNVFVGNEAVSTAATNSTENHEFTIAADKRDVGTIYVIKVTNANNMRISKIEVFGNGCEAGLVQPYGWATYITTSDIEYPANTAYVVTGASGSTVTLAEVTQVPEDTPILLKGEGAKTAISLDAAPAAPATNLLKPGTGAVVTPTGGKIRYVLGVYDEKATFLLIDGTYPATVPLGKAYLEFSDGDSAPMLSLDGNTTGISTLNVERETLNDNSYYMLDGRRVAQPTKGLYIVNGKKVIIK